MSDPRRYPMGLGTFDFVKTAGKFSLFFLGGVFVIIMIITIISIFLGSEFVCLSTLFSGVIIISAIFGVLIILLMFSLKPTIFKKFPNHVEISGMNMIVTNTWSGLYPSIQNVIPLFLIKTIERPNDEYFKERWRKTHWFFKVNAFTHKPPHGGLYIPHTSRKNLLILHLREPVPISNTNFLPSRRPPLMKISEEYVKEIIIDIDQRYQNDLINEILMRNRSMN